MGANHSIQTTLGSEAVTIGPWEVMSQKKDSRGAQKLPAVTYLILLLTVKTKLTVLLSQDFPVGKEIYGQDQVSGTGCKQCTFCTREFRFSPSLPSTLVRIRAPQLCSLRSCFLIISLTDHNAHRMLLVLQLSGYVVGTPGAPHLALRRKAASGLG